MKSLARPGRRCLHFESDSYIAMTVGGDPPLQGCPECFTWEKGGVFMPESPSHKAAKRRAAGKSGKTEAPLKGGRRLDATRRDMAVEVEKSGNLDAAAKRLKTSKKRQKVLVVPQKDMTKARAAMREAGIGGTVKNISGTKVSRVVKPKKK